MRYRAWDTVFLSTSPAVCVDHTHVGVVLQQGVEAVPSGRVLVLGVHTHEVTCGVYVLQWVDTPPTPAHARALKRIQTPNACLPCFMTFASLPHVTAYRCCSTLKSMGCPLGQNNTPISTVNSGNSPLIYTDGFDKEVATCGEENVRAPEGELAQVAVDISGLPTRVCALHCHHRGVLAVHDAYARAPS